MSGTGTLPDPPGEILFLHPAPVGGCSILCEGMVFIFTSGEDFLSSTNRSAWITGGSKITVWLLWAWKIYTAQMLSSQLLPPT
jgi:hypothetical protein